MSIILSAHPTLKVYGPAHNQKQRMCTPKILVENNTYFTYFVLTDMKYFEFLSGSVKAKCVTNPNKCMDPHGTHLPLGFILFFLLLFFPLL